MIRNGVLFILIITLFLIGGCKEEVVVEGPFVGGSEGLSIQFLEGAPISEFRYDDLVPVKVVLKNNGEYDINENLAEVKLYGLAMQDYGLSSEYKKVSNSIPGIRKDLVEEGAEVIVDSGVIDYQGQISSSYEEPTLFAKVCYPYQTAASVSACASSRQIIEGGGEIICNIGEERINSKRVSGSPLQITSFKEELEGIDKVRFRINIENLVAGGEVYSDNLICSQSEEPLVKSENLGKVKFKVFPLDVTCVAYDGSQVNEGYIKLDQGKKTLICTMPVEESGSNYKREISIYLDFKYMQSTSKKLRILEA